MFYTFNLIYFITHLIINNQKLYLINYLKHDIYIYFHHDLKCLQKNFH